MIAPLVARISRVRVVEARADYKGRLKIQFEVDGQYYCSTLRIVAVAGTRESIAVDVRAMLECDIDGKVRTSNKRMKL